MTRIRVGRTRGRVRRDSRDRIPEDSLDSGSAEHWRRVLDDVAAVLRQIDAVLPRRSAG